MKNSQISTIKKNNEKNPLIQVDEEVQNMNRNFTKMDVVGINKTQNDFQHHWPLEKCKLNHNQISQHTFQKS